MTRTLLKFMVLGLALSAVLVGAAVGVGRASPRGHQIAFSSDRVPGERASQIWLMDVGRRLVASPTGRHNADFRPAWSPDGRYVSFWSQSSGDYNPMFAPGDGGAPVDVNTYDGRGNYGVWSPDGRYLGFTTNFGLVIYDMTTNTGIAKFNSAGLWAWSPDGTRVVYTRTVTQGETYGTRLMTGDVLTEDTRLLIETQARYTALAWSPDGQFIAVEAQLSPGSGRVQAQIIELIALPDAERRTLTTDAELIGWQPDSSAVLVQAQLAGTDTELMLIDSVTGQQQNVSNIPGVERSPVWSPDGTQLAFEGDVMASHDVYVSDPVTGVVRRVTALHGEDFNPQWSPDGRYLTVESQLRDNHEIFLVDLAAGTVSNLTNHADRDTSAAWRP